MRAMKNVIRWILIQLRIYPNVFFLSNPLKIYEFKELIKGIKFSNDDQILDFGCGNGLQTLLLGEKCREITGVDVSENEVAKAKRKSEKLINRIKSRFLCTKLEEAGFKNESFDKVFSICVIEHISNYTEVLREIYRVLKKRGQMIFSVDCLEPIKDSDLLEKHRKDCFVVKYFNADELKKLLADTGFTKIDIYPIYKSSFAANLFVAGVNNRFRYGFLSSIVNYLLLRNKEEQCSEINKGIFLVAKCSK